MIAYHVDRANLLKEDDIIDLQIVDNIQPSYLNKILTDRYPEGLSNHGNTYYACQANLCNVNDYIIETFYEYERQLNFSNKISRMQSFFAIKTINELHDWLRILETRNNSSVWEIKFDHDDYLYLDSTWLMGDICKFSTLVSTYNAQKYWSGEISSKPRMELLIKPPIRIVKRVEVGNVR